MFDTFPDVVTVCELAKMLNVGRNTAYELVSSGQIVSIKVKTQIRIPKKNIIRYIYNRENSSKH
jgi:excisionase family DNA binding protein